MASLTALYPGSFDPLTHGHLDILRKATMLFDHVVVAVGVHHGKAPFFGYQQRRDLIQEVARGEGWLSNVTIASFDGLVIEVARRHSASVLVRGLRDGTDLDYEMQMAGMNGAMAPEIATVFLPASPAVRPITATLVRQIAAMGGDVAPFVPPAVAAALRAKPG